ncbi:AraC family transcriptional regulator [Tropicibacter sp. S64]|uniref:AraC family transcriptional regulator n=1 Tax=Tropicibacter sp. S64 TaxID=3415122 RepID=UPI003C7D9848
MRDEPKQSGLEDRIRRVIRHIFDTPAGDLSLDALAEVAALSRFHFHRVFAALTGETVAGAVRRIRVHRASIWLVQTRKPVAEVAALCGYDNAQSFARVFKAQTGLTPLAFRRLGQPDREVLPFVKGKREMMPSEIRDLPEQRLVGLPHRGPYYEIGRAYQQVAAVFSAKALWPQAEREIGVYFDSIDAVEEADLRSFAGLRVSADFVLPDELEEYIIPGGRHLVTTHKGPYAGLPRAWEDIYCNALPASGAEPADRPPFECHLNSPMYTRPEELLTEIYIPLVD